MRGWDGRPGRRRRRGRCGVSLCLLLPIRDARARDRRSAASASPTRWTPRPRRCAASRSTSPASRRPRGQGRRAKKEKGGQDRQEGRRQEPGRLHAPVLRDDRRRPAARAVPRHSRLAGRGQELRVRDPRDADRRRVGRVAGRRDAQAPEDLRSAVHQHDRRRRGGRHPRHDSEAARDLHRKGRQAGRAGEVRDDLPDRGHRHRRRASSASFCGRSSRRSRRCSRASAPTCRCRRASSSRSATTWSASSRSCSSAAARPRTASRRYYATDERAPRHRSA